jgi:hypothetical protein
MACGTAEVLRTCRGFQACQGVPRVDRRVYHWYDHRSPATRPVKYRQPLQVIVKDERRVLGIVVLIRPSDPEPTVQDSLRLSSIFTAILRYVTEPNSRINGCCERN